MKDSQSQSHVLTPPKYRRKVMYCLHEGRYFTPNRPGDHVHARNELLAALFTHLRGALLGGPG